MLKIFEAFAGVGSQVMALRNLGIPYESVGISEIDKYAIQSYELIHGKTNNYGDISKINWSEVKDFDLFTYSFPCQDLSLAGKRRGLEKGSGTRSSLLWECERCIKEKQPSYLLLENVKGLITQEMKPYFKEWLKILENYGYTNYCKVLNAKDYGIPQNRERVFVVSIRKDIEEKRKVMWSDLFDSYTYEFPKSFDNGTRLKHILENDVDDKYYLSDKIIKYFYEHKKLHKEKGNGFEFKPHKDKNIIAKNINCKSGSRPTDNFIDETKFKKGGVCGYDYSTKQEQEQEQRLWSENGNSSCITTSNTNVNKIVVKENTKKGYAIAENGDSINIGQPNSKTRRGRVGKGVAQTLTTQCEQATISDYRIRKLTPRECWRLMAFSDEDFNKVNGILSNTQLYRQAGNSICVNVLEFIFYELFKNDYEIKRNPYDIITR